MKIARISALVLGIIVVAPLFGVTFSAQAQPHAVPAGLSDLAHEAPSECLKEGSPCPPKESDCCSGECRRMKPGTKGVCSAPGLDK